MFKLNLFFSMPAYLDVLDQLITHESEFETVMLFH
jgi:hypothetical protein